MNAAELAAHDRRPIGRHRTWPRSGTGPPSWPPGTASPSSSPWPSGGSSAPSPADDPEHVPAHPVRGPIDIVGAGDAVTANLAAALAAGAEAVEAMELAMVAASIVIHQLGTTGTAPIARIAEQL